MAAGNPMQDRIKHVVVVMLENRGFDSVLGYLYRKGDEPKHHVPAGSEPAFDGLDFVADKKKLINTLKWKGKTYLKCAPEPGVRATNSPGWDPHEEFEHVTAQIYGAGGKPPESGGNCGASADQYTVGFLQDYASHWTVSWDDPTLRNIEQIMRVYTPADLPVLSALAKGYAVCDRWFSSVPTQTNANRAFSLCGTSMGLVDNGFRSDSKVGALLADDRFPTDTLFNVLHDNGCDDWAVFWHTPYPPVISSEPYTRRCFPSFKNIPSVGNHFHKMDRFFDLAEAGELPAFSYIEPQWGGAALGIVSVMGNEYHPPSDATPGEKLLSDIYASLTRNEAAWNETLLVITFDEHGGTYDHVVPPTGAKPPWGDGKPGFKLQHGFPFNRFGVRVPTILVSPYIEDGTVFRSSKDVPYDHTSVIATILNWRGIPESKWKLGERVASAPTFEGVLTRKQPRTDNIFAPKPPPVKGTPLHFGDPFCLKHMNGESVVTAYSGNQYYFPRLGHSGPVCLDFRLGYGEVANGAVVQIRTSEYLEPQSTSELVFAGIRNFLGAWKDQHDCYYYSSDDANDYRQQYWKISRVEGGPGPIRYGDKVYISSEFEKFRGQRLNKDKEWLSTTKGASDWWTVESPPEVQPLGPVVKANATVRLKHMSGDQVTSAYSGTRYYFPKLGPSRPISLRLTGGAGDLVNRAVVGIQSTEKALGGTDTLGAFPREPFNPGGDCYYWTSGYDKDKQGWMIVKVDDAAGRSVHYGEKVYLINVSYKGQRLCRDKQYLTTSATAYDWWTIEKAGGK